LFFSRHTASKGTEGSQCN